MWHGGSRCSSQVKNLATRWHINLIHTSQDCSSQLWSKGIPYTILYLIFTVLQETCKHLTNPILSYMVFLEKLMGRLGNSQLLWNKASLACSNSLPIKPIQFIFSHRIYPNSIPTASSSLCWGQQTGCPLKFSDNNCIYTHFSSSHACYISTPWFNQSNNTAWRVQMMRLIIISVSSSCYFFLCSKNSPQHFILKHPQSTFFPQRYTMYHIHVQHANIYFLKHKTFCSFKLQILL